MKMLKWAEIGSPVSSERYQLLSEFMTRMGVQNELSLIESSRDDFQETLKKAKIEFDHIRVGDAFTEFAFDPKNDLTSSILVVKAADCLAKTEDGRWWPSSLLHDAFIKSLAHRIRALDLNATALVIGSEGSARAVITALARVGFSKFNIADRFQERGQILLTDLRRSYFRASFEFVPPSGITALPGMHSVLVNCTPFWHEDEIIQELQFFNFLKEGGAVVDLVMIPPKTPLLDEAAHIGAKTVRGDEVAAEVDAIWVQRVTGLTLDLNEYGKALFEKFAATHIPPKG